MEHPYMKMRRKAAEYWWKRKIDPRIAYYKLYSFYSSQGTACKKVPVTWSEVHGERTKRQLDRISVKRIPDFQRLAAILSVNSKDWTCGFAICRTIKNEHCWVDYDNEENRDKVCKWLMDNFPLGILCFDFNDWKRSFEEKYGKVRCFITLDRSGNICSIDKINNNLNK
jgi:hypothetical protein